MSLLAALLATDLDTAKVLFVIGAVLAAAAATFSAVRGGVEAALGWGSIAFGLVAAWVLL